MVNETWTEENSVNPGNRKFVCRLVDKGVPSLEAIKVYDLHNPRNCLYIKDRKALNELIQSLEELAKEFS